MSVRLMQAEVLTHAHTQTIETNCRGEAQSQSLSEPELMPGKQSLCPLPAQRRHTRRCRCHCLSLCPSLCAATAVISRVACRMCHAAGCHESPKNRTEHFSPCVLCIYVFAPPARSLGLRLRLKSSSSACLLTFL